MTWEQIKILVSLVSVLLAGCDKIEGYLKKEKPETPPEIVSTPLPVEGNLVPATIYWDPVTTYEDGSELKEAFYSLYLNNELFTVTQDLQIYSEWKVGDCFYVVVTTAQGVPSEKSNVICLE